jgi:hypothetical protein
MTHNNIAFVPHFAKRSLSGHGSRIWSGAWGKYRPAQNPCEFRWLAFAAGDAGWRVAAPHFAWEA